MGKKNKVLLDQIMDHTIDDTIEIGDLKIGFTYNPHAISVEMTLGALNGEVKESTFETLARLLIDWDLAIEEGEPFPPTFENIKKIPTDVAMMIVNKITKPDEVGEAGGSFSDT